VNLPGGLHIEIRGEQIRARDFSFRPITGALEMQLQDLLHECSANDEAHPVWISRFLTTILARLATQKISPDDEKSLTLVRELCVADRHYLLLQWRLQLAGGSDYEWLSAHCPACTARYDFPLEWAQLPVKPAGENFPQISFLLNDSSINNGEAIQVRVPRGSDQEFIAQFHAQVHVQEKVQDEMDLRTQLLQRLIIADNPRALVQALDEDEIVRIETALEQAAPELAQQLQLACPECGEQHQVQLDWYRGMHKPIDELLDQIHRLAANYHWSEQEILALPKQRRTAYLRRLDRDRGISSWADTTGAAL
jgi:hypothetical protein